MNDDYRILGERTHGYAALAQSRSAVVHRGMDVEKRPADYIAPNVRDAFLGTARRIGAKGFARCSSGNLSRRIDGDTAVISASRSWLERLSEGDLTICRISTGERICGNRPSVETGMHTGILRVRSDVNVVLHFQSPAATAFCCRDAPANFNVTPEIPYYLGPIGRVPYLLPGSPDLAKAATEVMGSHDLALLQNHGIITVARDLDSVVQHAEFFELACEILLYNGADTRVLADHEAAELTELGKSSRGV